MSPRQESAPSQSSMDTSATSPSESLIDLEESVNSLSRAVTDEEEECQVEEEGEGAPSLEVFDVSTPRQVESSPTEQDD